MKILPGFHLTLKKFKTNWTTIKKVVPDAEETISYGIPTFNLNGTYPIYFAAYKKHIGFYPVPSGIEEIDKGFASLKLQAKEPFNFR